MMGAIYIETKPVQGWTVFDHLYLIYEDNAGNEFVIRGGPLNDDPFNYDPIVLELGVPMSQSEDFRPKEDREAHGNRMLDLGGRTAEAVWQTLLNHAAELGNANLPYYATSQNSNSVIASMLHVIGLNIDDNVPDANGYDWTPAKDNILDSIGFNLFGGIDTYVQHSDILWGGASADTIQGYGGTDQLSGYGGDDILVGNHLATGFKPADLTLSYFQTGHTEWNDGVRDVVSGGDGHDTILIAGDTQSSDFFYFTQPPSDINKIVNELDFVVGKDSDFIAHVQYLYPNGTEYFSFTQSTIAAAVSGDSSPVCSIAYYSNGQWSNSGDVYGYRVEIAGVGDVLLLGSAGFSWGTEFYAGVTMTRDLSAFTGEWTVMGTGSANAPNLQAVSSDSVSVAGNDTLYGGNTEDGIYAYGGDDTIVLGTYAGGADYVDGGSGTDTADYSGSSVGIIVDISTSTGSATIVGGGYLDTLVNVENINAGGGNDTITGSAVANRIDAHGSNDIISGGAGDDIIYGGAGADNLNGGLGNDILSGDGGTDTLVGGDGSDIYYVDVSTDVVTEVSGSTSGVDTVYSTSSTYTLSANVENIVLLIGAGDAIGNALNNVLTGNDGNNHLDGLTGADIMTGGLGDDLYNVDNSSDQTNELSGGGNDRVVSTISWTLAAGNQIEELDLDGGVVNTTGTGNELNNLIIGSNGDNTLSGLDGNDTLKGGLGHDILNGGNGNDVLDGGDAGDTMTGGAGDDVYYVSDPHDYVVEQSNGGTDTVYTTGSVDDNVEIAYLMDGYQPMEGSAQNNTLYGNSIGNYLNGKGGSDIVYGLAGADQLFGGAGSDTLIGGTGNDELTGRDTSGTNPNVKDVFVFEVGGGKDITWDFESGATSGHDVIDLRGISEITGISNLKSSHLTFASDGDAIISWGSGDQVRLDGITSASQLVVDDFLFA